MMELPLTRGLVAILDDVDYGHVAVFSWQAAKRGPRFYAMRIEYPSRRAILLHRALLDAPRGLEVDHRNGNSLDNRRENLRLCTRPENNVNYVRRRASKTSRFRGVSWHRIGGKWMAQIRGLDHAPHSIQYVYLGLFADETEAARAYDRAALNHHGEFAVTNFPREDYQ